MSRGFTGYLSRLNMKRTPPDLGTAPMHQNNAVAESLAAAQNIFPHGGEFFSCSNGPRSQQHFHQIATRTDRHETDIWIETECNVSLTLSSFRRIKKNIN